MCNKQIGIEVEGAFFNRDGSNLNWESFIEKIETVGLEYGGKTLPIDEDGNVYKVNDINSWDLGDKINTSLDKEKDLLEKYLEINEKMESASLENNKSKYDIAKKELKTIRMTLGILGISIKGINA